MFVEVKSSNVSTQGSGAVMASRTISDMVLGATEWLGYVVIVPTD